MPLSMQNDSTKTATFLLESLDNIPNIEEINDSLNQESCPVKEEERNRNIFGAQIHSIPQINENHESSSSSSITVSAVVPRSKFTLSVYEKGCIMTNNKNEQILLHCNDIKHAIVFPKREDCVKAPKLSKTSKNNVEIPGSMFLALLEEGKVNFRNKSLTQICFQLPQHLSQSTHEPSKVSLERSKIIDEFETKWVNLLESSLGRKSVRIYNPRFNKIASSLNKFQSDEGNPDSSMIQGGMPYVKCYKGKQKCICVNQSQMYPLFFILKAVLSKVLMMVFFIHLMLGCFSISECSFSLSFPDTLMLCVSTKINKLFVKTTIIHTS